MRLGAIAIGSSTDLSRSQTRPLHRYEDIPLQQLNPSPAPTPRSPRQIPELLPRFLDIAHRSGLAMKFSHSLQFNSVPDWADKYIAYSNLKKTIYQLEKDEISGAPPAPHEHGDDIESESAALLRETEASESDHIFIPMLNKELRKIVAFYNDKERELENTLIALADDIERVEEQEIYDEEAGDDDVLSDDEDADIEHRNGAESTQTTLRGTVARKGSVEDIFANPQKYNEAARERGQLHEFPSSGGESSRGSRNRRRSSVQSREDAHIGARPGLPQRSTSQLIDVGSTAADTGMPDLLSMSMERPRTRSRSRRWSSLFKGRSSGRTPSLGIVAPSGDVEPGLHSAGLPSSEAGGSSSQIGEPKSMSIWTANNDYAIDVRIAFKRRITDLFVALSELKQFVQLNETGMKKILKKYDKIMKRDLKDRFLKDIVAAQHPFTRQAAEHLENHITSVVQFYAKIVTGGDLSLALAQLKDHLREQVVWQRNTVWREMIGIERRAQGATLQNAVMGSRNKASDGEKVKPTKLCGLSLPSWLGMPTLQLLTAFLALVLFLKLPALRFFSRVEEQNCLAMLIFCTILWATEVIPLFVTSLMVPFLVVTLRVARTDDIEDRRMAAAETTKWIFSQMFAPNMCLLLGGFTLAAALSKYSIDKVLAQKVLRLAGTRPSFVLLAHMAVACFASMWISNVAAPVLMFSLIQPILRTLPPRSNFGPALIMGIALASNIGGQTSPIASPQNLIALQYMPDPLGWLQWFAITIPVSGISLVVIWLLLLWSYGSGRGIVIKRPSENRDGFSRIQYFISAVSVATIALWCLERNFEYVLGDMGVIAIVPMILFFGTGILTKEDFNNFLWTIVFLAMGGIALGKAVTSSGLLESLDGLIQELVQGMPIWKVLFCLLTICLVVATFISHTIAAVLLVPIAAQVGDSLATPHPRLLIMATTLTASAAMGLPVSGFPNMAASAQEDSTGKRYISVRDFLRVGVPASVLATVVIGTVGYGMMHLLGL